MPFGNSSRRENGQKAGCGSEPCERRVAGDRWETASGGPTPAQVTDLRLLPPDPAAAVSRGVERFAEQPVFWPVLEDRISEGIEVRHMVRHFRRAAVLIVALFVILVAAAPRAEAQGKLRIAVINFQNNSSWTWWGDQLGGAAADEVVTQLVKTGKFSVIERAQLEAILAEQRIGQTGLVNPATAARVGQLLGAQLIMTGSITQFSIERTQLGYRGIGGAYSKAESRLDARVIDTTTGEVLLAADGAGSKRMGGGYFNGVHAERTFDAGAAAEALRPAVTAVVSRVTTQSFKVAATLAPTAASAQIVGSRDGSFYLNKGENAGIKIGQRFTVKHVVDEIKDADGRVLDKVTKTTGVLEVTQVLTQSAIAKVVEGSAAQGDVVETR